MHAARLEMDTFSSNVFTSVSWYSLYCYVLNKCFILSCGYVHGNEILHH